MVEKSPKTLIINKKTDLWILVSGCYIVDEKKTEINILCFLVETFQ